jgi:RsiW-degrading membrane proteinase PrsW (M82 family)
MHILEILKHLQESSGQTLLIFLYALIGGIVPALFWLWFWMRERTHAEPRRVIAKIFLLGMISVFITAFMQKHLTPFVLSYTQNENTLTLAYVIVEELLKFFAAYVIAFRTRIFDEPIDAFVYLMTAAIGFAAMENTLYLIQPLLSGESVEAIITTYTRFIGSSILHVTATGFLSVCIGLSFCKCLWVREFWILAGLVGACIIHFLFNVFLIIQDGSYIFLVFSSVWITAIGLILMLEKVKQNKCMV